LSWLGTRKTISGTTAKQYFEDFKNLQVLMGFDPDPNLGREKRTAALIKGLENVKKGNRKPARAPVSFETLKSIRERILTTDWEDDLKVLFWGCCLISFFGSMRIGELLPASSKIFDPLTDLSWADIAWIGSEAVTIRIKSPKANKGEESVVVFELPESKNFCPVRAFRHIRKLTGTKAGAPIFGRKDGHLFSSKCFARLLKIISDAAPPLNISGQSFRAGIPSLIENHPALAADNHIKNWGRWRSVAYQKYMRYGLEQKRWLFGKIRNALIM